jgi:hypothetical protein
MPGAADTALPPDPALARARFRRVVVQVFAVEIVTVTALWILGLLFGSR